MFRSLVAATIATGSVFGAATAAQAVTFNVTSAGLYNNSTARVAGTIAGNGAFDRYENVGAVVLQGTTDAGKPFSVITYCFDLLHNIGVGFGYQAAVNYSYTPVALTTDLTGSNATGNSLSTTQIERMSGLARLGATLFSSGATDLTARMAAVQAAIWSVEYNVAASEFSAAGAQSYYTNYMARSFPGAHVPVLVSTDDFGQVIGSIQGQGIGSVPEPQNWALLILGFGVIGLSSRRKRMADYYVSA